MAARLAVFLLRQRGFAHQRPQPGVVGFVGELAKLLLGDPQVVAKRPELLSDATQPSFDLGHSALEKPFGARLYETPGVIARR